MTCNENLGNSNIALRVVLLFMIVVTCYQQADARRIKPCVQWCPMLERVSEIGRTSPSDAEWALAFLRAAAENQPHEIDEASAHRLGLRRDTMENAPFWDVDVRRTAFRLIATLPAEISIPYLRSVTPDSFPDDSDTIDVYPHVRIALHEANMLTRPSREEHYRFLANTLQKEPEDDWFIYVQKWSAEELCDKGVRDFLPLIEGFFLHLDERSHPQRLQYCQERMTVVNSHSDRSTALKGVLTVENARSNERLVHWAIAELKKLRTEEAKAAVTAYLDQLEAIPGRSPLGREVRNVLTAYGRALVPPRPVEAK
jgi:hypothetical protein